MDIKGLLMDHLGFFAPHQVLNAVVGLLVAAVLGLLLGRWGGRLPVAAARSLALWAALASVAVVFVRTNLPLAVALVALVLLVRGMDDGGTDRRLLLGALLLGGACGAGAAVGAVALAVPLIALFRWAHAGNGER